MVEEAGQVLEAHVISALVPSGAPEATMIWLHGSPYSNIVQHLICIGDPQQLRPNVSTFGEPLAFLVIQSLTLSIALSMDSASGRELFRFDRSLMERLSDMGMAMSQINVQRRMRPSISHFVRCVIGSDWHTVPRAHPYL
jgi:hypothetical protein